MISRWNRAVRKRSLKLVTGLIVAVVFLLSGGVFLLGNTASAATTNNDPDSTGTYNWIQMVFPNTLRVYAKPVPAAEYIFFRVSPGTLEGTQSADLCTTIALYKPNNTLATSSSTCNSSNTPQTTTIKAMVGNNEGTTNFANTWRAEFAPGDSNGSRKNSSNIRGYKWRVWVATDEAGNNPIGGRVWFDGDKGFRIWQSNTGGAALTPQAANFSLTYVRKDGYRYRVRNFDYQGIWSSILGGVYGVNLTAGDKSQAYQSFGKERPTINPNFTMFDANTDKDNKAYVYVDCLTDDAAACPAPGGLPDPTSRTVPITAGTENSKSGAVGTGNPIYLANKDPAATSGFRYTGYSSAVSLLGGTVTMPYVAMQSGAIELNVFKNGTLLCKKEFVIDDSDGSGEVTWSFSGNRDTSCTDGTLRSGNVTATLDDVILFTAQARRLGEMHFISRDTERRGGGIQIVSNNPRGTAVQNRSIIWNDPFSRRDTHTCGLIPPSSGTGAPAAAPTTAATGSISSTTGTGAGRGAVDSLNGIHGWTSVSGCDADGEDNNQGHANDDGTATTHSTWGNNRVIEDWTYAFNDPDAQSFTVGGPQYSLDPSVTVTPSTISPGQSVAVATSASKSGRSSANNINWSLYEIVLGPTQSISGFSGTSSTANWSINPCATVGWYPAAQRASCASIATGTSNFTTNGSTAVRSYTKTDTASLQVGSQVCYLFVISPYTTEAVSSYSWKISCTLIAASPYLTIHGGTTWAGGSTSSPYTGGAGTTMIRTTSTSTYGSFGEYGVFSTGSIQLFGSAARLNTQTTSSMRDGTRLTFANPTTQPSLGSWSNTHRITDLVTQYTSAAHTASVLSGPTTGATVSGSGVYKITGSGSVTLSGITGTPHAVIYAPTGTVTISGDITYNSTGATSFKALPSLTVIANNIYIRSNVRTITGNFYAANQFATCDEARAVINPSTVYQKDGTCSNPLVINGAVTVTKTNDTGALKFNRSRGGTGPNEPAEVISMRPEVFLTKYENSINSSFLTTKYERELPARY